MLNFLKKYVGAICTFFITLIITIVIFYAIGIFDGTILISDLNSEYQPLLMQTRKIFTGQLGIYNLNLSLGDNFLGTFFYYMSSPLNILSIFIKDINLLVIVLVILKISLSSSFCYLFFKYQFKEEKKMFLCIFSILYALSSYSIAYYLHIMWLDIYMLLPLLLLGIDKIIKEKKHLTYIISLILIIFCNYYFAYMICIFSFIYYNYKLLLKEKILFKNIIKNNIHFIIINILSIACASIVIIPVISEINTYSRHNNYLLGGESIKFNFNIISIIKHYILGNYKDIDILNENDFYIYSSIITIPLIYFYFINKKFNIKEKVLTGIILLIFLLSISCNYLNYIWHGFVPPSFFNGRYTFMFIIFILFISLRSIYNFNEFKIYHYFIITFSIIIILFLSISFTKIQLNKYDCLKLLILVFYTLIFMIQINNNITKTIFTSIILVELITNSINYLERYNFDVTHENTIQRNTIKYIKENDNNLFYRIEDNNSESDNYSITYNYYSIDYFMSTIKKDLVNFFINLDVGNHSYTKNTISYDGSYHLLSSLLGIKYYIETNNYDNNYEYLTTIDDTYKIYKNNYSLNIGYMVNEKIKDTKLNNNGLENLNNIYYDMTKINVLEKIDIKKIDDYNYKFNNKSNKDFYLLVKLDNWYSYDDLKVYLDNELLDNRNGTFMYHINNIYNKNDKISINIDCNDGTLEDIEGIYIYYINDNNYKKSIDILKNNQLEINKIKNNSIEGNITVDDNNILFTSIPYDKDLYIYVDGKKVNKTKVLGTFLGTKLDKGEHKIVIKYIPRTLYLSIIPSIIGQILLYIYIKIYKKKKLFN